jgi:PPOX class probable F420-dependent enzyme
MSKTIDGRVKELLEAPNFVAVASLDDDGSPDVKVVWADLDDGHVVLNSAEGRKWPQNVRRDPRVTVTVVNYEYAQIRGRVVDDTHDGADENIDALAKKYLGKDEYPFRREGEQRVMFRIQPERVRLHGG